MMYDGACEGRSRSFVCSGSPFSFSSVSLSDSLFSSVTVGRSKTEGDSDVRQEKRPDGAGWGTLRLLTHSLGLFHMCV